jgi:predicted lipoprotein with Yx(FWY)xxD motif
MTSRAHLLLAVAGVVAIAGCGSSSTSTSSTPSSSASASESPSASASSGASGSAVVATKALTIGGATKTVLTDATGLTLYWNSHDTATTPACFGGCAGTWPPLLLPSGTPTSSSSLTGTLAVVADANGNQVAYNGHLLYRYSVDTAPGQLNGDGKGGIWFAATEDVSKI